MDQLYDVTPIERRLVDKATQLRIPISAAFELTPLCNLSCDMCYVRMNARELAMLGRVRSMDEWMKTAEELKAMGTLFILLTGGEPLLYPGFKEIYLALREMGFIITINTNATLITEEVAELFSRVKPRRLNVSLYGGSNETYQNLCHTTGGYDRCLQGLRLLKKYHIDTKLNLTIIRKNRQDYETVIRMAEELDMPASINCYTSLFCSPTCTSQLSIPEIRLAPEEVATLEIEHLKYKYKANYHEHIKGMNAELTDMESAVPNGVTLSCRAGKSSCWINWQGMLSPCVDMATPSVSLATHSVAEAWQQVVEQCTALPTHTECSGCKLSKLCNVCYANATNEKKYCGDTTYLCAIGQAKRRLIEQEAQR